MFNDHSTLEARAENEIPLQSLLLPFSPSLSLLPSAITMFLRIVIAVARIYLSTLKRDNIRLRCVFLCKTRYYIFKNSTKISIAFSRNGILSCRDIDIASILKSKRLNVFRKKKTWYWKHTMQFTSAIFHGIMFYHSVVFPKRNVFYLKDIFRLSHANVKLRA